ncbi:terminase large subunit [Streptomyces kronopolitis]|uniref:terminase large subunit domain-containing protein n=1 Tax=Streptomyces kronopolitis TaxID=1612435 RepID=UPI003442FAA8
MARKLPQAEKVIKFIESFLTLGGSYEGQPFKLLPFQKEVIRDVYATDANNVRTRRTAIIGMARKNGKTELGAALAVYGLIADTSDASPRVYSVANDRQQARLCFEAAKGMIQRNPDLRGMCDVQRDVIRCHRNGGEYRVLSADAGSAQGLSPTMVVFDELAQQKQDDLWAAMRLGSAARKQPLMLAISTAGPNVGNEYPYFRLYEYGRKVRSGEVEDPSFTLHWWGPDPNEEVDPYDPGVWRRYNPAWELLSEAEFKSSSLSTHEVQWRTYRINQWVVGGHASWFPHGKWDGRTQTDDPLAAGDAVILGVDGAHKGDCTAIVACRIRDLHTEPLAVWEAPADDPHWRTPRGAVKGEILDAVARFKVRGIISDPYWLEETLESLAMDHGLADLIEEFPTNSLARIVPATKAVYDVVMDDRMTHNGDATLARHVQNAVVKDDYRGVRITKNHGASGRKIDAAVAMILAVHGAVMWREDNGVTDSPIVATWEDAQGIHVVGGLPDDPDMFNDW